MRRRNSAPRWMRARHAGSATQRDGCATMRNRDDVFDRQPAAADDDAACTCRSLLRRRSDHVRPFASPPGTRPEIEEIEPLVRCLAAIVFETRGITLRPRGEMLRAFAARQLDALGERLEIEAIARRAPSGRRTGTPGSRARARARRALARTARSRRETARRSSGLRRARAPGRRRSPAARPHRRAPASSSRSPVRSR